MRKVKTEKVFAKFNQSKISRKNEILKFIRHQIFYKIDCLIFPISLFLLSLISLSLLFGKFSSQDAVHAAAYIRTIYVDMNSINGTCSDISPTPTNPATTYCHIGIAVNGNGGMKPGDQIYVEPGNYCTSPTSTTAGVSPGVRFQNSGTATNPILITKDPASTSTVNSGIVRLCENNVNNLNNPPSAPALATARITASHITLQNITIEGGTNQALYLKGGADVTLNGVTVENSRGAGITADTMTNLTIQNSNIKNNARTGIKESNLSKGLSVLNSRIIGNGSVPCTSTGGGCGTLPLGGQSINGDGIQLSGSVGSGGQLVQNNTIIDNGNDPAYEQGIYLAGGNRNTKILNNTFANNAASNQKIATNGALVAGNLFKINSTSEPDDKRGTSGNTVLTNQLKAIAGGANSSNPGYVLSNYIMSGVGTSSLPANTTTTYAMVTGGSSVAPNPTAAPSQFCDNYASGPFSGHAISFTSGSDTLKLILANNTIVQSRTTSNTFTNPSALRIISEPQLFARQNLFAATSTSTLSPRGIYDSSSSVGYAAGTFDYDMLVSANSTIVAQVGSESVRTFANWQLIHGQDINGVSPTTSSTGTAPNLPTIASDGTFANSLAAGTIANSVGANATNAQSAVCVINSDVTPPTDIITTPITGATASGQIIINDTAADNSGIISKSQLYVDGSLVHTVSPVLNFSENWTLDTSTLTPGAHTVRVEVFDSNNNAGYSQIVIINVQASPKITSISPTSGPVSGGGTLTVSGSNLIGVNSVTINDVACTNVVVVSDSLVNCTIPASSTDGTFDVTIANSVGSVTLPNSYTYTPDISLTLSQSNVNFSLNSTNNFENYGGATISTATNASHGYTLSSNADCTSETCDANGNLELSDGLGHFFTATTSSTLDINSWGWQFDSNASPNSTAWSAVPAAYNVVSQTDSANSGANANSEGTPNSVNVFYGARSTSNHPSGTYQAKITFTAIANP